MTKYSRIIVGPLKNGKIGSLLINIRKEFDEQLYMISLVLSNDKTEIDWKYPIGITRLLIKNIKELAEQNNLQDELHFETKYVERAMFFDKLLKKNGYYCKHMGFNIYKIYKR